MSDDITAYPHTPDQLGQVDHLEQPDDLDAVGTGIDVEDDELTDEDELDEGPEPVRPHRADLDDEDDDDEDDDEDASAPVHPEPPTFAELGVRADIVASLARVGITHPFPIQAMTLPVALTGHDIIGQAKTGTGKTLGFGIPLLQQVAGPGEEGWSELAAPGKPQALVIVPTRELAVQVAGDLDTASKGSSARVLTVYGGRAYEPQVNALRKGVEVVAGTPGRLLDLCQQGHLDLGHARVVVLDEADEMLDLGFLPDVERLLSLTPAGRQTMLFSATMPGPVVALARRFMTQPTHIRAADPDDTGATVKATAQFVYRAHALDKVEMLSRILQARGRGLTIVFARTKRTAAKVAEDLDERGFAAAAIHGDLGQGAREQALRAFRKGKIDVLVATDVAARGIDVDDVTHVINYQCPEDEKTYLHRIGRTGRAGNTGTAVTFVDWDEVMRWSLIDKALDLGIPEAVETYSSSPHLYSDLDIPTEVRGRLPEAEQTRAGLDAEEVEDLGETGRGRRSDRGAGGRNRRGKPDGRSDSRSDSRSAGRPGGRRSAEDTPAAEDDAPRPRRDRQRRRTRGGQPIDTDGTPTAAPGTEDAGTGTPAEQSTGSTGPDAAADGTGSPARSRRRRSRGGRSGARQADAGTGADAVDSAATAGSDADGSGSAPAGADAPAGTRAPARRTRPAVEVPVVDGPQALFLPPPAAPADGSEGSGPDGAESSSEGREGGARRTRRRGGRGRSGGGARTGGTTTTAEAG